MSILTLRLRTPALAFPAVEAENLAAMPIAGQTVIERAARALCRLAGFSEDHMHDQRQAWEAYVPQVRAVLGAIRHPDIGMTMACEDEQGCVGTHEAIYRAMIDAALADDSPKPMLTPGQ